MLDVREGVGLLSCRPPPKLLADADYRPALYRRWCGCCLKDGEGLEGWSLGEKIEANQKRQERRQLAPPGLGARTASRHTETSGRDHVHCRAAALGSGLWALALGSPSFLRNKPSPLHLSNRGKNILTPIFLSYSDNGPCKYYSRA
jgi:hypothetical protein